MVYILNIIALLLVFAGGAFDGQHPYLHLVLLVSGLVLGMLAVGIMHSNLDKYEEKPHV